MKSSTHVVYPLTKSPSIPQPSRKLQRYADQPRRNTYSLENSSASSSSEEEKVLVNTKPEYVRLDSQGFDLEQQENPFHQVKDARSTFSIPNKRIRMTRQEAQLILERKLGALIKGHLTRQLLRTDHVKGLIQTLNVILLSTHEKRKVRCFFLHVFRIRENLLWNFKLNVFKRKLNSISTIFISSIN